jgi:energy-coupling factor transporter ATP-binding protein EcfA2
MLTSITINGLRGIAHGELNEIAPLTVIVGPNGSGKSTILDAINIAARPNTGEAMSLASQRRRSSPDFARWLFNRGRVTSKVKLVARNGTQHCEVRLEGEPKTIKFDASCSDSKLNTFKWNGYLNDSGRNSKTQRIHLGITAVHLVDSHGEGSLAPIHELHSIAIQGGHREQENRVLSALVPGAQSIDVLTSQGQPVAHVVFPDHSVPVSLIGDGIQAVLRLALEAMLLDDGLLILEEPEVHLHPAAQGLAAKVIVDSVRRGLQVILTTHSLELIDRLVAECEESELDKLALFQVRLDAGDLKVARIPGDEVAFMRGQIEDDLR